MIRTASIPQELYNLTRNESIDFIVEANKLYTRESTAFQLLSGLGFIGTAILLLSLIFLPIIFGNGFEITVNGVPQVATLDNLAPIQIMILGATGCFLLGVGMFASGIYKFKTKGGYFIGTPKRLIHYHKGSVRSVNWSEFTGDILVRKHKKQGDLYLKLKTGKLVKDKSQEIRRTVLVPDSIALVAIDNYNEVEAVCRRRINENDTTSQI
jgi:hypothetical protein